MPVKARMKERITSPWGLQQPISEDELPVQLKTRRWKKGDPDWEDRPQDPRLCGDLPRPPQQETLDPLGLEDVL